LKLDGVVGEDTFGINRYLNQSFYKSQLWRKVRRDIIIRDGGCDLAMPDREIRGDILVHHINPITIEDLTSHSFKLLDPNNLVCVAYNTHNAIHYGDEDILDEYEVVVRTKNDMCPWKN